MLQAGLDLSRRMVDSCLLSESGEHVGQLVMAPDADALRTLARRIDAVDGEPVCAVIESMTAAPARARDARAGSAGRSRSPLRRR
jgi:hypothetical protein